MYSNRHINIHIHSYIQAAVAIMEGRRAGGGDETAYGECPICLDIMDRPYSTECDHFFCYDCIMGLINR
jgi:hypothetical protein